ncbi:hypothetical protein [Staphylococcus saprophyticus]|uniref:hypothetical protein n=1 Tax=Staphylococcus saprophyticus TaxID=29385 RepID=UPI001642FBAA|nr:hypothetical protein [Staphylococcus saprophyticus]
MERRAIGKGMEAKKKKLGVRIGGGVVSVEGVVKVIKSVRGIKVERQVIRIMGM